MGWRFGGGNWGRWFSPQTGGTSAVKVVVNMPIICVYNQ